MSGTEHPVAGRSGKASPDAALTGETLTLNVIELGPRGLALIDWGRETGREVDVVRRGRVLARLVPVAGAREDPIDDVTWDLEAIGP